MERGLKVLFAGGDMGGVRCLVPVAEACLAAGLEVRLVDHGSVASEWRGDPARLVAPDADILDRLLPDCLVFSSSVDDAYALGLARAAARKGLPVLHLLDHWSSYSARLATDGGEPFRPTLYTVIDERARREALADGIAEETLLVVGQPALHDLAVRAVGAPHVGPPRVLFVGEPVLRNQGGDDSHPLFRGYTEFDAIDWFAGAIARSGAEIDILLLPHPHQPADELLEAWRKAGHGIAARLAPGARRGRDHFGAVEGLVGMASMLLYEGWLYGLPVLSVQPYRRRSLLGCLTDRDMAWLVDQPGLLERGVADWLRAVQGPPRSSGEAFEERERHKAAPSVVVEAIRGCVATGRGA